jgi:hypothetical protein
MGRVSTMALGVAALAFAACSPSAPATDGATTEAAAPAAPAPAALPAGIPGVDGPLPGKWRTTGTVTSAQAPAGMAIPPTPDICVPKHLPFEESMKAQQAEQEKTTPGLTCPEISYKKEGDAYIGRSVCTMAAGAQTITMTMDSESKGDFKTKYTTQATVTMSPDPGVGTQTMSMVSERIGDC